MIVPDKKGNVYIALPPSGSVGFKSESTVTVLAHVACDPKSVTATYIVFLDLQYSDHELPILSGTISMTLLRSRYTFIPITVGEYSNFDTIIIGHVTRVSSVIQDTKRAIDGAVTFYAI